MIGRAWRWLRGERGDPTPTYRETRELLRAHREAAERETARLRRERTVRERLRHDPFTPYPNGK